MPKDKNKNNRKELLKAMHTVMMNMNDENAYAEWIVDGVPDEPDENTFDMIADDPKSCCDVCDVFLDIMDRYKDSGLCM